LTDFRKTCWSCGSSNFRETISKEECFNCGIVCDYHGSGCNEEYREAMHWKNYQKELEEERREAEEDAERDRQRTLDYNRLNGFDDDGY